jgi:hypothetical protein
MYFESYIVIFSSLMHTGIRLFAREKITLDFCKNGFVSAEPALTSFLVTSSERSWGPWTRRLSPPGGSTLCSLPFVVFPHWVSQLLAPHAQVSQLFGSSQVIQLFYSLPGESAVCSSTSMSAVC